MPRPRATKEPLAPRLWAALRSEGRHLYEGEEGATLIFAAVTFWAMTVAIAFVYQVGLISADRLQIQGAADAAAYSGALVEANSLNAIGQVNDGLTYVNYMALRHVVDVGVYSVTLSQMTWQDRIPAAKGKHGFAIMGGDGGTYEGNERIDYVNALAWNNPPSGNLHLTYLQGLLRWTGDLHFSARMIARSTPELVRDTAGEIARLNGASHIGFATNLDAIWNYGDDELSGFSESGYRSGGDQFFVPSMYERYEKRKTLQVKDAGAGSGGVEAKAQGLPRANDSSETELRTDWFDAKLGEFTGEYYQVRICWSWGDWEHKGKTAHGGDFSDFSQGVYPNGHWHWPHAHSAINPQDGSEIPNALPHPGMKTWSAGGYQLAMMEPGGHGEPDDDPTVHAGPWFHPNNKSEDDWAHHKEAECFCCGSHSGSEYGPRPQPGWGGKYSEWKASSERFAITNALNSFFRQKRSPLVVKEGLLRSALTVVAYRPSRGLGDLFPASPWGMLGVASAQVGIDRGNGVLPLRRMNGGRATYGNNETFFYWADGNVQNDEESRNKNLFYDHPDGDSGFHFSARLVPIANELTWHPEEASGKGLGGLLKGGYYWYSTQGMTPAGPQDLGQLGQWLDLDPESRPDDVEVFWH